MPHGPKVLILDIEMLPHKVDAWQFYDNNVGFNQINRDGFMASWSAKWWGLKELFYQDLRRFKNFADDKKDKILLPPLVKLINAADIVVGHNVKKFDLKSVNARNITNRVHAPENKKHLFLPPNRVRTLDTLIICKRYFKFPSYSLEYLTSRLCPDFKKMKSRKFIGHELWTECERANPAAWDEMEKYNKQDVRATEALWNVVEPYDNSINFNVYTANPDGRNCKCGGVFVGNGTTARGTRVLQRLRCKSCGAESVTGPNLVKKEFRKGILK